MILVSACLAGKPCRYDGTSKASARVAALVASGDALAVCPEQLGHAGTPRPPCEIQHGSGRDVLDGKAFVTTQAGEDVTDLLLTGANKVLRLCQQRGITQAWLKTNSPSCGCGQIYDGSFTGRKIRANGVTAQILLDNGISVEAIESE